ASMNERLAGLRRDFAERFDWRLAGAGAAGAAIMFLLFLAVYVAGAFSPRDQTAPLAARLAALEPQVRALADKPQPAAVDPGKLADLESRLAKTENAAAASRPAPADRALTDRVAALEGAVRPLADLAPKLDGANALARDA